jgi:hypothetical protein
MPLHPDTWFRRLTAIVAALFVLLPAAVMSQMIANAQSVVTDELAYSQQTEYFFFWDPATLSLQQESSAAGIDYWLLTDGEVNVNIWAYTAPGVTSDQCVADFLDQLAADPATRAMETLPVFGGGPLQQFGNSAQFVLTADGADGQEKFAAKVECGEVVPGQSLFLIFVLMPARVYNEKDTQHVSWSGADYFTFVGLQDNQLDSEFASVPDETGTRVGTLTTFLPCNVSSFDLVARAEAGREFVVDRESLFAVDNNGAYLPVTVAAWSLPEARRETSLALRPGALGLLHGVVAAEPFQDFDLYFAAPGGQSIFLAEAMWGCGAGGGAPVLIDIE